MKIKMLIIALIISSVTVSAQPEMPKDSIVGGIVTVTKDPRLVVLGKKVAEFNDMASSSLRSTKGYRLLILNSNDREYTMKVRTQLLQKYPDQKLYMSYQAPYFKLKFGNFAEKDDAEKYRKMLTSAKLVTGNIYLVPDTVEVKGDKNKEKDDD